MKTKITKITLSVILIVFLTGYQLRASSVVDHAIISGISLIAIDDENPLKTVISVNVKEVTVADFFNLLKEKTGGKLSFIYVADDIKEIKPITLNHQSISIAQLLSNLLSHYPKLTYSTENNVVTISKNVQSKREKVSVSGKIINATTKKPIVGATVIVVGTTFGSITDGNGHFAFSAYPNDILDVSYVGMKQINYSNPLNNQELIIEMEEDAFAVENVIVTGYQKLSKERATGSFAVINKDQIGGRLDVSLMDRISGMVAGLTDHRNDIRIRGKSTINGNDDVLIVVDGVPFEGNISAINPSEVANVTVLKDATAASIYGARSANGVIVITTRSGSEGPTKVRYNGSVKLSGLPDREYQNMMTSRELVDFQETLFNLNPGSRPPANFYLNEVRQVLFDHKDGKITADEKERQLDIYRNRNNEQQIIDEFLRECLVTHQHNLSVSGGSKKHTYALSMNYLQNLQNEKAKSDDRLGFNLKNSFQFNSWFRADVNLLGSFMNQEYNNGYAGMSVYSGTKAPYMLLYDEDGNKIPWYQDKSQAEIDRLKKLGLMDETYYPTDELNEKYTASSDNFFNANVNLNFKVIEGLTVDVRYQTEMGTLKLKNFSSKDSWEVKTMINNATQIKNEEIIQNIPQGGQLTENRSDRKSSTIRGQINYDKDFGSKHSLNVIVGGEVRKVESTSMGTFRLGFDDSSLSSKVVDEKTLRQGITGTQALTGKFSLGKADPGFVDEENRYISFYGNASYTFDDKLTLSASIRMDQSNLFGTDPKYQYRPLWSFGSQYMISRNQLEWLDRLSVRATYGINGNVAKTSGPYLIVQDGGINQWTDDYSSKITFAPNSGLRWERTAVFNLGLDFSLFKTRLGGSIEFYNKNTSDLLHNKEMDPTYGWSTMMINYGDMYNRGIEISLNSKNIAIKNFLWTSTLNFSYNKNKLTNLEGGSTNALSYINGGQTREGLSMGSLYSVRWGGLDSKGNPQAYDRNGDIVSSFAKVHVDDLVYSGVSTPPYAATLTNTFRYKTLSLSFMFSYYGGHVMRGMRGNYIVGTGLSTNQERMTGNFWQKSGDENDPSKSPAFSKIVNPNYKNLWDAADKHIQKADYIKLNNLTLGYDLPSHLFKNNFIEGVTVLFQAQDIWKWAANDQGLDPEAWSGIALSSSRGNKIPATYSIGLSLNF